MASAQACSLLLCGRLGMPRADAPTGWLPDLPGATGELRPGGGAARRQMRESARKPHLPTVKSASLGNTQYAVRSTQSLARLLEVRLRVRGGVFAGVDQAPAQAQPAEQHQEARQQAPGARAMPAQDAVDLPQQGHRDPQAHDRQEQGAVAPAQQRLVLEAFDARTGKPRWAFRVITRPGEVGNETWENDSWSYSGQANLWSLVSSDDELGLAYLPLTSATNDMSGGHRLGDNLFANTLVCGRCATGERVWHYQIVHHDLWDYDLPAAPVLADITVNGQRIKAVVQVTKQAFAFVFDRTNGRRIVGTVSEVH